MKEEKVRLAIRRPKLYIFLKVGLRIIVFLLAALLGFIMATS